MRLVTGYDLLYPHVRDFMREYLSEGGPVDLEDPAVLCNLAEPYVGKLVFRQSHRGDQRATGTRRGNC
jgi:hypothetical protein